MSHERKSSTFKPSQKNFKMRTWLFMGFIVLLLMTMNHQYIFNSSSDKSPQKTQAITTQTLTSPCSCRYAVQPEDERLTSKELEQVDKLLRTHPDKETKTHFLNKIRNGDICLGKRIQNTDDALFQTFYQPEFGCSIPFIYIRSRILKTGKERFAQLVLYHEFVHYQQWIRRNIGKETDVSFKLEKLDQRQLVESCKKIWYAELEAYQEECRVARTMGISQKIDLCSDMPGIQTTSTIERHLFQTHQASTVCVSEWRKLLSGS